MIWRRCPWLAVFVVAVFLAGCVISPRRPDPNASSGAGGTTTTPPATTPPPTTPPATPVGKLYVSNENTNSILRFDNAMAATVTGNIAPAATITGASTLLDKPGYLLVDTAADRLYVTNSSTLATTNQAILVFDAISTKTGNVASSRVITGAATGLTTPIDLALDKSNDMLYVADGPDVLVFSPASSSSGNVSPSRTMTVAFTISAMLLDTANNILYLADSGTNTINVYDGAKTLTGTITANRSITGAATGLSLPSAMSLDGAGRLVVSNANPAASITIYGTPSAATGNVTPAATISGASTGFTSPVQSAFHATTTGELYVGDVTGKVLIYGSISTANGNLAPTRAISGASTGFNGGTLAAPTTRGVALDPTH